MTTFVQVVLSLVFPVFLVVVHTELARLLSVTCVGLDACSLLPRFGANGTRRSTLVRSKHGKERQLAGLD